MGFIFKTPVPKAVAANNAQLIQNCQGFSVGVEKFSLLQRSRVAAAKSPTTAGRKPVKMEVTVWVCMYRMNILLIKTIKINEGNTNAKVAVAEPKMAIGIE